MLVPKRVKHRREFRGKMRGEAKGGKTIAFGEYGLEAVESHWITNRQIEAARIAMPRSDGSARSAPLAPVWLPESVRWSMHISALRSCWPIGSPRSLR